jgi:3-oxoadipate enol-lactonase
VARLHAIVAGAGPTLLLLHGIGGSATAWTGQIERLRVGFRCVAPDLPGYGDSPAPRGEGLGPIVEDLAELLGTDAPVHAVGVSFGALVALALAHRRPACVASLLLADPTLGRATLSAAERARWLAGREALAADLATRSEARAAEIAGPHASPEVVAAIASHMRRARPEGYLAVARAIAATDARPWLGAIRAPATVVCGEHDRVTGLGPARKVADALGGSNLVTIAGAGHAPHLERPDAFAAEVLAHAERVGALPG